MTEQFDICIGRAALPQICVLGSEASKFMGWIALDILTV